MRAETLAERRGVRVDVLTAEGGSALERLASLTAVPDFASLYLALAHGFDPMAVPAVNELSLLERVSILASILLSLKGASNGAAAAEALAAEDIQLLLVRTPRFLAALDASSGWERAESFGDWILYRPRAPSS